MAARRRQEAPENARKFLGIVAVELVCPEELSIDVNAPLVQQAVINLIDNAVKYSDADARVVVSAAKEADGITIAVVALTRRTCRGCSNDSIVWTKQGAVNWGVPVWG